MSRITQTKQVRLFEDVPIKNKDGMIIGYRTVRRAMPLPADDRKVIYLKDGRGFLNSYYVSIGQIINAVKYQGRRDRKDKKLRIKLYVG